jgi:hypothetical protein
MLGCVSWSLWTLRAELPVLGRRGGSQEQKDAEVTEGRGFSEDEDTAGNGSSWQSLPD